MSENNHDIARKHIIGHKMFLNDKVLSHNSEQISFPTIDGTTYNNLKDFTDVISSAGKISGGDFTDNGDGTVTVSAGTGLIRATDSVDAEIMFFDWSETTLTVNEGPNYIYVKYNAGNPVVTSASSIPNDRNTNVVLGEVYKEDGVLHVVHAGQLISNYQMNTFFKDIEVNGKLQRSTGLMIYEDSNLAFGITTGTIWAGLTKKTINAFLSTTDTFTYVYQDGSGGWTKVTGQTIIDNQHYDDGSGTLATLGNNRYGVHWVYQLVDGSVYVVYGRGNYLSSQASAADPPTNIPDELSDVGRLPQLKALSQLNSVQQSCPCIMNSLNCKEEHQTSIIT